MTDSSSEAPVEPNASEAALLELVEEFTRLVRAGESPDADAFATRLPGRESELRELLITVGTLEQTEPVGGREPALFGLKRIGGYRIDREIGRGGMGVVLLATEEALDRQVALKFLPVQATLHAHSLERFKREARAAARLSHPNIIPVFGIGEAEGLHFFVMQYIEGSPLDEVARIVHSESKTVDRRESASSAIGIARRLWTRELSSTGTGWDVAGEVVSIPDEPRASDAASKLAGVGDPSCFFRNVARIGIQAAEALSYAHSHGILHRDVKPGNVLLETTGRAWIADFGLCKTSDAEQLTMASDLVGTLRYMAPEQVQGKSDVRTDVYGLGATLYELLAGRPPFEARGRAELMSQVVSASPRTLRRHDRRIPRDLETVVQKAMAKLPAERYGTADALVEDLRAFQGGYPISARPPSAAYLLRLTARRHRGLVVTSVVALAVVVLMTMFYVTDLQRSRREQRRQLYLSGIAAAQAAVGFDATSATARLENAPAEHRNWEWAHLLALVDQSQLTLAESFQTIHAIDFTPDGRLELVGFGETVRVRERVQAGREWLLEGSRLNVVDAAIDARGEQVAAGDEHRQVLVWSLGETARLIGRRVMDGHICAVLFDAGCEKVFVGTADGLLQAFDVTMTTRLQLLGGHGALVSDLDQTRDGSILASSSVDGGVRLWDPDGNLLQDLDHGGPVWAIALDPSGALLASAGQAGAVRVWEVASGRLVLTLNAGPHWIRSLAFHPGGRLLAAGTVNRTIHVWDLTTGFVRELHGHRHWVDALKFRPDDGILVSAGGDGTSKEWNVEGAGGELALTGHLADYWNVGFGPHSRRLATTSRDSTVRVWDAQDGSHLRTFFPDNGALQSTFSPDGGVLAVGDFAGQLYAYDLDRGVLLQKFSTLGVGRDARAPARGLCFDPSGSRLYAGLAQWGLELWEASLEGWRHAGTEHFPELAHIAISPDGTRMALAMYDGVVRVVELPEYDLVYEDRLHEGRVSRVAFRRDGEVLASAGYDGQIVLRRARDGGVMRTMVLAERRSHLGSPVWSVGFNHDGSRMITSSAGSGISLWDTERGELTLRLQGPGRSFERVAFSPDGQCIAQGFSDGRLRILDTKLSTERPAPRLGGEILREAGRVLVELGEEADNLELLPDLLHGLSLERDLFQAVLARAHAEAGTRSAIEERCVELLRRPGSLLEDARKVMYLAWGLAKEDLGGVRNSQLLGEALYRMAKYDEALPELQNALRLSEAAGDPSFDALVFLAMTSARRGRLDEAQTWLARAREQDTGAAGQQAFTEEAERTLRDAGVSQPD